ncbi:hypothetical protein ACJMK2_001539, partial [Sinanodonta woodiana]
TADREPDYWGCVVTDDMLIAIDHGERSLDVYNLHGGKRITSHRLKSWPCDVCLINKKEVAVCLGITVVILPLTSRVGVKHVSTLQAGFDCRSLVKWRSDKLVISGVRDDMLCWRILSITDGRLDSTHVICTGWETHMAVREDTVYISCQTLYSITDNGVYAFNLLTNKQKFLYQHRELKSPESIMADRDYVYVCDMYSNGIHQLTDSGQLVTIHTVSSEPRSMFYDDQQGLIYTTSGGSNVITVYKMESSPQQDSVIPAEVLKMDTESLHIYKNALCDGYEKVYNIRVMVVGQYGVGKTTLTQRLLGKNVNISERHSTEGIDVHVECSKVSLLSGEWTTQEKHADKYSRLQRLVRLLNEHSNKQQSKRGQDRQSELDVQVISLEYDNSHTQHNLLVSKERYDGQPQQDKPVSVEPSTNQIVKEPSSQPVESPIVRLHLESSSGIHSKGNEKDTVMKILKQVNETSGKLEKDTTQYAALTIWDFAGQHSFYTTHQTFLTSRAIYLLVINLSQQVTAFIEENECFLDAKGKQLCNIPEMIEIWLNMIHSCAPISHPGNPPVIIIGTHVDKIPEKNRQKVIDEYFMKLRQMLKSKPLVLHLMDDIAIDNTLESDPSLEKLKRRIFELASQQPYWGEEKPARWLPLEQAIMTMRDSDVKVAPLSLIEEINRSSSVKIEDRGELELFLNFQHDIGTILYFNADGLRENIVLNPQWMIDVFRSLITAKMFIKQHPTITEEWFEFEETGKLTHKLIDAIWTEEKPDFHDNKEYLLLVMEKLNIIAKPMSYTMDGESVKHEDYYLAPCILKQETPKEIICHKSDNKKESTSALCFVCKEKCLPPPIFHRLVGACLTHWAIAQQNEKNLIYCGCCVFDIDKYHRLFLHFLGHVIFARVTIIGIKDISKSSKLCSEARKLISKNLSKITENLGQSLEFEPHIQCPGYDADILKGMIAVPELEKEKEVVCHAHDESHTLETHQLLKFWFENGEQTDIAGKGTVKGFEEAEKRDVPANVSSISKNKGVPCSDPTLLSQLLQKSQQAGSSSQSTLEANCLSVGLEVHDETTADGNCFFEAVSSQLWRLNCVVQKSPQQLRQEVVVFMRNNRVIKASEGTIHLDSFIYNESFDDYCSRMARDGEWADHVVVVAMARMLQMDIMIVTSSPSSGPENIIVWVVGKTDFQEDPIILGHVWESHYMSLQPIGPSIDDKDRFMHIACLLVNVGTRVLRRLLHFHTVTPTCTIDQYLDKNITDIDNLRKRKILNKSQMAILFPTNGITNVADYDITLLSALFTNIVHSISQQQLDMIQSLRDKRNEIAHAESVKVNLKDYRRLLNAIRKSLVALSRQCNDSEFENEITREIRGIQLSSVQGTSLFDTLQTHHIRMETLESLVQDLISSQAQLLKKESA